MLKHNKKQNVGLLYEFFIRHITHLIIENKDNSAITKAKTLVQKYFNSGRQSELSKELALFKVLYESTNLGKETASSLIEKVKTTAKTSINNNKLREEKNALLLEIHKQLKDSSFFDRPIEDYKIQATIQVLLNSWKSNNNIIHESLCTEAVLLEERLFQHLTSSVSNIKPNKDVLNMTSEDVDRLVINIMTNKLNKKFSEVLNEAQCELLQNYIYASKDNILNEQLNTKLLSIKERVLKQIDLVLDNKEYDKVLSEKLSSVKNILLKEYVDITDETITFYMGALKLEEELLSTEEKEVIGI
jgi:hypothetical protein